MKLFSLLSTLALLLCCSGVKVPEFIDKSMPPGRLLEYNYSESGMMSGTTEEYRVKMVDGRLSILSKPNYNHQVYVEIDDTTLLDTIRSILVKYKAQNLKESYVNPHVLDGYSWHYTALFERQSKDDYDYSIHSGGSNSFPKTDMFTVVHQLINRVAEANKPAMLEGPLVYFEFSRTEGDGTTLQRYYKAEKKGKDVLLSTLDDGKTYTAKAGQEVLDSLYTLLKEDDAQCLQKEYKSDYDSMNKYRWTLKARMANGKEIVSSGCNNWPTGETFYYGINLIEDLCIGKDKE